MNFLREVHPNVVDAHNVRSVITGQIVPHTSGTADDPQLTLEALSNIGKGLERTTEVGEIS